MQIKKRKEKRIVQKPKEILTFKTLERAFFLIFIYARKIADQNSWRSTFCKSVDRLMVAALLLIYTKPRTYGKKNTIN